jgi:hypothetical protein
MWKLGLIDTNIHILKIITGITFHITDQMTNDGRTPCSTHLSASSLTKVAKHHTEVDIFGLLTTNMKISKNPW